MMLDIVFHPDKRLRDKAVEVKNVDTAVAAFAKQMLHTMRAANGIGLAGPQVGHMKRMFVVGLHDDKEYVFINPTITASSAEESDYNEGCLSIPNVYATVRRPIGISIDYLDIEGNTCTLDAEAMLARVIQHEMDHLNGVLFIDYLSQAQQDKLMQKYISHER